jgi:hypothetical protein
MFCVCPRHTYADGLLSRNFLNIYSCLSCVSHNKPLKVVRADREDLVAGVFLVQYPTFGFNNLVAFLLWYLLI